MIIKNTVYLKNLKYKNHKGPPVLEGEYFLSFNNRTFEDMIITVLINHVFVSFFAVPIYDITFYGYFTNSQCDQLSAGLIAQLVEHCTGIAEVMGLNPVQVWIVFFSYFNFTTNKVVCTTAMINRVFISFSAVQMYDLSCIHLQSNFCLKWKQFKRLGDTVKQ